MQSEMKRRAAEAAVKTVPEGCILGVGTGSTVDLFIQALAESGKRVATCVSSSVASTEHLRSRGFTVAEPNDYPELALYVDGADEVNGALQMIKGGGGAHTREKILGSYAEKFVCIVDESKLVEALGAKFQIPLAVLPFAERRVEAAVRRIGGNPKLREGVTTDDGHLVIDVFGLPAPDLEALELELEALPGVVCSGLFARRPADVLLVGGQDGFRRLYRG